VPGLIIYTAKYSRSFSREHIKEYERVVSPVITLREGMGHEIITTMTRNEISFLRRCRAWAILALFSLKFTFHPSNKGLGTLQNVNCEEGSGRTKHMYSPATAPVYTEMLNNTWGANECFKKLTRFSELFFVPPFTRGRRNAETQHTREQPTSNYEPVNRHRVLLSTQSTVVSEKIILYCT
jgi:hypothetical protein